MLDPLGKAKLASFVYVALPIENFLKRFQSDEPLIPYLSEDLIKMMRTLMNRIVKPDIMKSLLDDTVKLLKIDLSNRDNLRHLKDMDLGFITSRELQQRPGSDLARRQFSESNRQFIVTFIERLKEKSPLQYCLVRNISCLAPEKLVHDHSSQLPKFQRVLKTLVEANHVNITECDQIMTEFAETVAQLPGFCNFDSEGRLDSLYYETVGQNASWRKLWSVIRTLLLLSHGKTSVERSFSSNKYVTTHNISEKTLIARRVVKDHLRHVGGLQNVMITNELLKSVRLSRQRYNQYLTQQREDESKLSHHNKRKHVEDPLKEMKKKMKEIREEQVSLTEKADKLALEAENHQRNTMACIVQSNAEESQGKRS